MLRRLAWGGSQTVPGRAAFEKVSKNLFRASTGVTYHPVKNVLLVRAVSGFELSGSTKLRAVCKVSSPTNFFLAARPTAPGLVSEAALILASSVFGSMSKKRSSFLHNWPDALKAFPKNSYRYVKEVLTNRYFWGGLGILIVALLAFYLLFNHLVMPAYTRYDAVVQVPDVRNLSMKEARQVLTERGLGVGQPLERFDRERRPNVILDQSPPPNAAVKPGRLIYVTVNVGTIPPVTVPRVEGLSLREARNRLAADGLKVKAERPDSVPSPYSNTITRQEPRAGATVKQGDGVTLWYSTGLGNRTVLVPDVTGMTVSQAQQLLLRRNLRSVVLDRDENVEDPTIVRQSRDPGTRVREGFELRLFTKEE